jgi:hypothetical protein
MKINLIPYVYNHLIDNPKLDKLGVLIFAYSATTTIRANLKMLFQ